MAFKKPPKYLLQPQLDRIVDTFARFKDETLKLQQREIRKLNDKLDDIMIIMNDERGK